MPCKVSSYVKWTYDKEMNLNQLNLPLLACNSSQSRNPFVEQAVQYAVAAAHARFDNNKKDELHKLLLQGIREFSL